jgi:NADPH:quinone reductase-like Zn-dependent oxidoreductase
MRDHLGVHVRPLGRDERATAPEQARADIAELADLLETGKLRAATQSLPLSAVVEAHRLLESRTFPGRLVLIP